MSEEPAVEFVSFPYPFVEDDDAKLRCFIAKYYANAEIDGAIQVQNLDLIYAWIKDRTTAPKARAKPSLVKP